MDGLEKEVDDLLEYHGIPQCSVVAVNEAGVVWKCAFGENCSIDTTQFHLFSGTKIYTATAIMKLVEERKLSLDTMVTAHLVDFDESLDGITIAHLLGHASGLRDTPMTAFLSGNFEQSSTTSRPSSMQALKKYTIKRDRAPGKQASYGNINYAILGEVIERVTGQMYEDYVRETILLPLGSKACFSFRDTSNLTSGWIGYWNSLATRLILKSDQYEKMFDGTEKMEKGKRGAGLYSLADVDVDSPSIGGLVGTPEDFAPLLVEFLRHGIRSTEGKSTQKPICLSVEGMQSMTSLHFKGQVGVHSKDGAGLGWKIGKDSINHEGGGPGFTTESRCYLEDRVGVVVMMNRWGVSNGECTLCHEISELIRKALKA
mmetsp:Transcript_32009/g.52883  ORF Transcript_32009/g.52883 Transcript_32009/m.52883 type:complete len:373 (+) Transcript_32009:52-1170(+)|eukprot:CAMPEP_0119004866 /NCGR_PEP_ID=MMETSP1176-20130426/1399_1 /TAXON_ID=265551 /ORGANISM="Synedropsis recta cf, Strain CCMP1620" /LENGTH=372 /DNA_ID=CAMNT_0006956621 /DNA_START=48 /DNA_END=1166 /DNA_ORIENTATION=+